MRICMLLRKQFPPDIRVEKEARALRAAGHKVVLLCRGDDDRPQTETIDGVDIVRIDTHHGISSMQRRRESLRYYRTLTHPRWAAALDAYVQSGIDAIHVHDLPLVRTGLSVGKRHNIPVVADLHENYPEAVRQWRRMYDRQAVLTQLPTLAWFTFLPIRRLKRIEARCTRAADAVLTVCEEGRRHYLKDCQVAPDRVAVVSNTVERAQFDTETTPVSGYQDEFVLIYVGKYAPHRGLEAVVRALPAVIEEIPNCRLLIVGAPGNETYGNAFRSLAQRLGITDHITFTGWVDFERVPAYMATADVCLVPHADTPHTQTTLPHKLFQYMAMTKPVLVSDVAPLKRIITETGAGLVAEAGESTEMADAILRFHRNPDWLTELGQKGCTAVQDKYHWTRDADKLRAVYRSL